MLLHRIALPFLNAMVITALLLFLMFRLIDIEEAELLPVKKLEVISWLQVPKDEPPVQITPKPPKPIEPEEAPILDKTIPDIDAGFDPITPTPTGFIPERTKNLANIENIDLIRIFGQPGEYPIRAITGEIEGYVIVGFSVNKTGVVYDAFVIESAPQGVFERSALKAIKKFKYKPKMVDGKPVATDGQQYMFSYKLDDD